MRSRMKSSALPVLVISAMAVLGGDIAWLAAPDDIWLLVLPFGVWLGLIGGIIIVSFIFKKDGDQGRTLPSKQEEE